MDALGGHIGVHESGAQLRVRFCMGGHNFMDVGDQLRVFFLYFGFAPRAQIVEAFHAGLKFMDPQLDVLAVPTEDSFGRSGFAIQENKRDLPHR